MPLFNVPVNEFYTTFVADAARPTATNGTTVTSSVTAAAYGSYVEVFAAAEVTHDVYGIVIHAHSIGTNGANHSSMVTIGVDPTATSTYTDYVSDVVLGSPSDLNNAGRLGVYYYFPIFVKAGSQIGMKVADVAGGSNQMSLRCTIMMQPRFPESLRVGYAVEGIGVTAASCDGTSVIPGTVSEGNWTSLGTLTYDAWFFQVGFSQADTTASTLIFHVDIAVGDGTNKRIIIQNMVAQTTTLEGIHKPLGIIGHYASVKAGETVYARAQCSGTLDDVNPTICVYAVR